MKKENNYISTDMNHKKLIVGVVIIHVCFMLIGASGIISTLKEKNIFYGLLINMIYQLTLIIMIGVAMKQYLITSFKKFKADRISVNIKRVLAGVGIAFLLSCIAGIIEMTVCSNTSVSANQSNVSGYFVDYPILAVIMSVIMGPFTEEIIYRGILFRFFSKYGELCAVLVTGFLFGTLYAPAQAILFGLSFKGMIAWIIAGLPWDFVHGISNFFCGILIVPIVTLLRKLEKQVG